MTVLIADGDFQRGKRLAAEWFQKAAVQGDERAMVNLSTMYEAGKGVEMDDAEAVRWAFLAAKGGHPEGT